MRLPGAVLPDESSLCWHSLLSEGLGQGCLPDNEWGEWTIFSSALAKVITFYLFFCRLIWMPLVAPQTSLWTSQERTKWSRQNDASQAPTREGLPPAMHFNLLPYILTFPLMYYSPSAKSSISYSPSIIQNLGGDSLSILELDSAQNRHLLSKDQDGNKPWSIWGAASDLQLWLTSSQ